MPDFASAPALTSAHPPPADGSRVSPRGRKGLPVGFQRRRPLAVGDQPPQPAQAGRADVTAAEPLGGPFAAARPRGGLAGLRGGHRCHGEHRPGVELRHGHRHSDDPSREGGPRARRAQRASVTTIPPAMVNTAALMPPAVATCSSSPASGSAPALATRTSTARPTAAPTPEAVLTIPEATPCSRSVTPVEAAMNMVVNTSPSPALTATRPGTSHA